MAAGDIGYKSTLEYGDGATPEVFTAVFQVTKITPPKATVKQVDMTHLESPGRANEFMAGFAEYGNAEATMIYDYTNVTHGQMFTDRANGTTRNWRYRLKNSVTGAVEQTHTFPGFIIDCALGEISTEARRELNISIKTAGNVVIT